MNAKSFKGYPIYSSLKPWILPINRTEVILRSSHYRRSAKIFEYVFFKIANLRSMQLHLCSKSMKEFNFGKDVSQKPAILLKLNSLTGIFWLFLTHLLNSYVVEHLPIASTHRILNNFSNSLHYNPILLIIRIVYFIVWISNRKQ